MKLVNKFKLGRLLINLHVQAVDTAGKGDSNCEPWGSVATFSLCFRK